MKFKLILQLPALFVIAGIWILSSFSTLPQLPKGIFSWDKLHHTAAYLAVAVSLGLWFLPERWQRRPLVCFLVTAGLASAYGIIDEVHQFFVPGRACDIWDWAADTLGAMLGAGVMFLFFKLTVKRFCFRTARARTY